MIFSPTGRHETRHPAWCDTSRCHVGYGYLRHDGHRSEPLTLGRVTLTLTQRHGESDMTVEVRARRTLTAEESATWRTTTWQTAVAIDRALRESADLADSWQNDHSMRDHGSRYVSTPNTAGGESR